MTDSHNDAVDVVITWVDGNDPALKAKRRSYMHDGAEEKSSEVGGSTRFASLGELWWNVASINRFAPWVRKIFIVTDGQRPGVVDWIKTQFDNPIPMEIVDHSVIFRGYEHLLPTFSSLSIETMLWRIPGLADNYIYMNDDMFFVAPNAPADRFTPDGCLVNYGKLMSAAWCRFLFWLKPKKHGFKSPGYKNAMFNSAALLHSRHFVYYRHSAVVQRRSLFEKYFAAHPDQLEKNASYRFRSHEQFSPQALCLLLAEREGSLVNVRASRTAFFKIVPEKGPEYIPRKVARAEAEHALQGCANSLDNASPEQRAQFKAWISKLLNIILPNFEN